MHKVLKALKNAAQRQGPIYRGTGILFIMTLAPEGILIKASWSDIRGKSLSSSKKIDWVQLEKAKDPGELINEYINREMESFETAKSELGAICHSPPSNAVDCDHWPVDVPLWQRGYGYTDQGCF